ncbi:hypothetical protein BG006_003929, partial [Podila minutissima]
LLQRDHNTLIFSLEEEMTDLAKKISATDTKYVRITSTVPETSQIKPAVTSGCIWDPSNHEHCAIKSLFKDDSIPLLPSGEVDYEHLKHLSKVFKTCPKLVFESKKTAFRGIISDFAICLSVFKTKYKLYFKNQSNPLIHHKLLWRYIGDAIEHQPTSLKFSSELAKVDVKGHTWLQVQQILDSSVQASNVHALVAENVLKARPQAGETVEAFYDQVYLN